MQIPQRYKEKIYLYGLLLVVTTSIPYTIWQNRELGGIIITLCIGLLAIVRQQMLSRKASTINLLTQEIIDKELANTLSDFNKLVDNNATMINYVKKSKLNPDEKKDRKTILFVLNYYEFVAGGIRNGAFDYSLFHTLYRSNIIRYWSSCETFVIEIRKKYCGENKVDIKDVFFFQEFESLAREFKNHKIKSKIKN